MTYGVDGGRCERVRCAIGLLALEAGGAACGHGSIFGVVVKFEGGASAGVDSTLVGVTTLRCGATLCCGNTLVGAFSLGGGGGGPVGSAAGGVSAVLVFQLLNRSQSLEMADSF